MKDKAGGLVDLFDQQEIWLLNFEDKRCFTRLLESHLIAGLERLYKIKQIKPSHVRDCLPCSDAECGSRAKGTHYKETCYKALH